MSDTTKIEWCDATWNGWLGCTQVSPGCDGCYAMQETPVRVMRGQGRETWGPKAERHRTSPHNWKQPRRWNDRPFVACAACGWRGEMRAFKRTDPQGADHAMCPECAGVDYLPARRRVFCSSLCDVFDNQVPIEWLVDVLRWWMETPKLDKLVLTKRIGNVLPRLEEALHLVGQRPGCLIDPLFKYLADWLRGVPPLDVWLGITVVNQEEADRDIPKLLAVPARVRFLSMEPLLGPVTFEGLFANPYDMRDATNALEALDWMIVGGESGPNARPMHPDWARSLRDQCQTARVPFLFKQWGEWIEPDVYGNHARLTVREGDPEFESAAAAMDGFLSADGRFAANIAEMDADTRYLGMVRVTKKAAGRMLDGIKHNGFPAASPQAKEGGDQ